MNCKQCGKRHETSSVYCSVLCHLDAIDALNPTGFVIGHHGKPVPTFDNFEKLKEGN